MSGLGGRRPEDLLADHHGEVDTSGSEASDAPQQRHAQVAEAGGTGLDSVAESLYSELRALARTHLSRERPGHTLQATAIVNEAYLRLRKIGRIDVSDRVKFLALAAQMIRRILVDHARNRDALKRQGDRLRLTLSGIETPSPNGTASDVDVLALHEALDELARLDERQARVIEMLFFAGMNQQEAADLLGVSLRTVQADSKMARVWLKRRLG